MFPPDDVTLLQGGWELLGCVCTVGGGEGEREGGKRAQQRRFPTGCTRDAWE